MYNEYMNAKSYRHLKSGSDVRGVAVGENRTLTDGAVTAITKAFIKWLSLKYGKNTFKVAVGNDSRISAGHVFESVKKAILSSGSDVVYTSLSSTPSMFMLVKNKFCNCDASVMITASHLPSDRNGLKFFTAEGGLDGKDVDEILSIAENEEFLCGDGNFEIKPYMDEYSARLVDEVRLSCGKQRPLDGKKIIVDAGNGAGGFFAEKVLVPLGADITGSQFLEPDGNFPNHIPNPEDKDAIASIKKATVESGADLGIIFDTDVDRAGAVDRSGKELNRNRLIALLSALVLKDKSGVIVTDSVTSDGLTYFIESLGGKHLRYRRGYKNVIDKCRDLNENGIYSPLAIETSGHAAFAENSYLDDGAYVIVKLLISLAGLKDGETLTDLISSLPEPAESDEVRISFSDTADFREKGKKVIEEIKRLIKSVNGATVAQDNYEGVRVNFAKDAGDGWFLLRMSVHDPVMPINFESNVKGGNRAIAQRLYSLLATFTFLNTENLNKFIHNQL